MSFLKRWKINYERAMRSKVLVELKGLPEGYLHSAGISPDLLKLGVDAWPWRAADMQPNGISSSAVKGVFGKTQLPAGNAGLARAANAAREFDSAA